MEEDRVQGHTLTAEPAAARYPAATRSSLATMTSLSALDSLQREPPLEGRICPNSEELDPDDQELHERHGQDRKRQRLQNGNTPYQVRPDQSEAVQQVVVACMPEEARARPRAAEVRSAQEQVPMEGATQQPPQQPQQPLPRPLPAANPLAAPTAPLLPPTFMPAMCQLFLVYMQRAVLVADQKPAEKKSQQLAADGMPPSADPPALVAVRQLRAFSIPAPLLLQAAAHLMVVGAVPPTQYQAIQAELGPASDARLEAATGQTEAADGPGAPSGPVAAAAGAPSRPPREPLRGLTVSASLRLATQPAPLRPVPAANPGIAGVPEGQARTTADASALAPGGHTGALPLGGAASVAVPATAAAPVAATAGAVDNGAPAAGALAAAPSAVVRDAAPGTAAVSWVGRGAGPSGHRLGLGRRLFNAIADQLPTSAELDSILPPTDGFSGVLYKVQGSGEVGAALWDGAWLRDLGPYTTALDARQSVVMSIKLITAAAAAAIEASRRAALKQQQGAARRAAAVRTADGAGEDPPAVAAVLPSAEADVVEAAEQLLLLRQTTRKQVGSSAGDHRGGPLPAPPEAGQQVALQHQPEHQLGEKQQQQQDEQGNEELQRRRPPPGQKQQQEKQQPKQQQQLPAPTPGIGDGHAHDAAGPVSAAAALSRPGPSGSGRDAAGEADVAAPPGETPTAATANGSRQSVHVGAPHPLSARALVWTAAPTAGAQKVPTAATPPAVPATAPLPIAQAVSAAAARSDGRQQASSPGAPPEMSGSQAAGPSDRPAHRGPSGRPQLNDAHADLTSPRWAKPDGRGRPGLDSGAQTGPAGAAASANAGGGAAGTAGRATALGAGELTQAELETNLLLDLLQRSQSLPLDREALLSLLNSNDGVAVLLTALQRRHLHGAQPPSNLPHVSPQAAEDDEWAAADAEPPPTVPGQQPRDRSSAPPGREAPLRQQQQQQQQHYGYQQQQHYEYQQQHNEQQQHYEYQQQHNEQQQHYEQQQALASQYEQQQPQRVLLLDRHRREDLLLGRGPEEASASYAMRVLPQQDSGAEADHPGSRVLVLGSQQSSPALVVSDQQLRQRSRQQWLWHATRGGLEGGLGGGGSSTVRALGRRPSGGGLVHHDDPVEFDTAVAAAASGPPSGGARMPTTQGGFDSHSTGHGRAERAPSVLDYLRLSNNLGLRAHPEAGTYTANAAAAAVQSLSSRGALVLSAPAAGESGAPRYGGLPAAGAAPAMPLRRYQQPRAQQAHGTAGDGGAGGHFHLGPTESMRLQQQQQQSPAAAVQLSTASMGPPGHGDGSGGGGRSSSREPRELKINARGYVQQYPSNGGGGGGGGGGFGSMTADTAPLLSAGLSSSMPTYGASYGGGGGGGGAGEDDRYDSLTGDGAMEECGGSGPVGRRCDLPPGGGSDPGSGSSDGARRVTGDIEMDATMQQAKRARHSSVVSREYAAVTRLVGLGLQEALAIVRQRQGTSL